MHEYTVFLSALFDDTVSAACTRRRTCSTNLRFMQRNAVSSKGLALEHDPLKDWATVAKNIEDAGTVCRSCAARWRRGLGMGRRRFSTGSRRYLGLRSRGGAMSKQRRPWWPNKASEATNALELTGDW